MWQPQARNYREVESKSVLAGRGEDALGDGCSCHIWLNTYKWRG